MKNELINFFRKPFNVCSIIGGTIGTIFFFFLFLDIGLFTSPTEENFIELHEQEKLIIEDFENVYSLENAEISIKEQEIIIEIMTLDEFNDPDYSVKMYFSKEKEYISSEEISYKEGFKTYPSWKLADKLSIWILTLIAGIYIGGLGLGSLLYCGYKVYVKIIRINLKKK